jgi:hypothetical protein
LFRSGQDFILLHLGGISVGQIGSSRCEGRGSVRDNGVTWQDVNARASPEQARYRNKNGKSQEYAVLTVR